MVNYELVKERLESHGELDPVLTDAGLVVELHLGDVEFDDDAETMTFEDSDGQRWTIAADSIEDFGEPRSHVRSLP